MHYKNTHFKVVEKPSTQLFFLNIKCKLLIFYLYPHKSVKGFLGLVTDVFTVHEIKVLYFLGIKNINVYQHTNDSVHKQKVAPVKHDARSMFLSCSALWRKKMVPA